MQLMKMYDLVVKSQFLDSSLYSLKKADVRIKKIVSSISNIGELLRFRGFKALFLRIDFCCNNPVFSVLNF